MTIPQQTQILRFANSRHGWALTPDALWSTQDGGATWRPVDNSVGRGPRSSTNTVDISGIELPGGTARFIEGTADGELALFTGSAERDAWTKSATVEINDYIDAPQIAAAHHANSAWFWVSGEQPAPVPPGTTTFPRPIRAVSGAELVDGRLRLWTPPCSGPDEHPVRAQAPSETQIFLTCASGPDHNRYRQLVSRDGGATFADLDGPDSSRVSILSAATTTDLVAEDPPNLLTSLDGGHSWMQTYQPSRERREDSFYLYRPAPGFITATTGFIIEEKGWISDPVRPHHPRVSTLPATYDAGRTWAPVTFPAPQRNAEPVN
ncbi:hypothetical protein [Nocardia ninae]|nr:hypothetical protein [Nocardia ninae]